MSANSLQLSTSPGGDLLAASIDGDGPSLTVERDTVDDGFSATLTFTHGSDRLLVVSEIRYGDDGKIVRSSIAADGPGVDYRLSVDFGQDPGGFFSGSKLDATVTVESGGVTHHGRFDDETWRAVGLEQAPRLPDLLTAGLTPMISPLRPALDVLVAQFHRVTGGTFPSAPGLRPTLAPAGPGTVQTFSWWGDRACKIGCAIAALAVGAACCAAVGGPSAGAGCYLCQAAATASGINCTENC
jgi:hypothetical protein